MTTIGSEIFTAPEAEINKADISMRMAKTEDDIRLCQRLRYDVFYEEFGAQADEETKSSRLDRDECDVSADHLMVMHKDGDNEKVIGTYRLITNDAAKKIGRFYTENEYDISKLLEKNLRLLELGRSCVLAPYRSRPIIQMLWQGLAEYIVEHNIDILFGCGSFSGTSDPADISEQLAYLHHYHPAPAELCPKALPERYVNMNLMDADSLNPREIFNRLPPLIKGYLRAGAKIGDGAVIDHQWNSVDVCIVFETKRLTERYRRHYNVNK